MLHKDRPDVMLKLAINGKVNENLGKIATLTIGQFVHFSIKVEKISNEDTHILQVHVNSVKTFERFHDDAKEFQNTELYCSSASSASANVAIKNFVFENLGD